MSDKALIELWKELELSAVVATLEHERCECAVCVVLRRLHDLRKAIVDEKNGR